MSFRSFVKTLKDDNQLKTLTKPISKNLEIAAVMKQLDGTPLFFSSVKETSIPVAANIFSTKQHVASYLNCSVSELIPKLMNAINHPSDPELIENPPCQEVIIEKPKLNDLPLLKHTALDGGNYIASGVFIVNDPELGQNASFHRMMQIDENKFAVRILERHLNEYLNRAGGELDASVVIGTGINFLLASAVSVNIEQSELKIANSLLPLKTCEATTMNVNIPANTEIVLEGKLTSNLHSEGPFVDLTETYDIVRDQRVFEVKRITTRKTPIYHSLLTGGLEHKILMGMPREPTIFQEVSKVCTCLDVSVNPGGCSWLHAIIKIQKQTEEDAKKAIESAFRGHKSLKHAFIVDSDIDIYNPLEIEWALATRFQGDKDLTILTNQKGSSLDPSSNLEKRETTKVGFDLTMPLTDSDKFKRAKFRDVGDYLK